jgi:hypothetical protein
MYKGLKNMLKFAKNSVQITHLNMTWKAITVAGNGTRNMAVMTNLVAEECPQLAAMFC